MGTCYSCQAPVGKATYPSDMSLSSNSGNRFYRPSSNGKPSRLRTPNSSVGGLRHSAFGSDEKLTKARDTSLLLAEDSPNSNQNGPYKANQKRTELGSGNPQGVSDRWKKNSNRSSEPDANRNLMGASSDSLDSISRHSSTGSLSKRQFHKKPQSYAPKEGARWKMIDDSGSTTTDSKSPSTQGKSQHSRDSPNLERDNNGNSIATSTSRLRAPNRQFASGSGSRIANPGVSKVALRLKDPVKQSERQWVKAGVVNVEEHKAQNVDRQKVQSLSPNKEHHGSALGADSVQANKKRRGLFSRSKGNMRFSQEKSVNIKPTQEEVTMTTQQGKKALSHQKEITKAVEIMLESAPEVKEVKQTINVLSKDHKLVQDGSDLKDSDEVDENGVKSGTAPLARLDSLETSSVCSLSSDDLMLETDIFLDDDLPNVSTTSLERSTAAATYSAARPRTQSRDGLSMSQPPSGLSKLDKRQILRRNPGDSGGLWRTNSGTDQSDGPSERGGRTSSTSEAVAELSNMMSNCGTTAIQRRPAKFGRERPASFPGPLMTDTKPERPVQFRQRKATPSIGEEEQVGVDANTFRYVMQDITSFKTMLLKLKRVIQEEEIGSPFGTVTFAGTLKNGYKLTGGSTPNSPMVHNEGTFAFADPQQINIPEVVQENKLLRQQMVTMQQQLEEHERTIKLLQQQMTKYECGHFGPGGKVFKSNATTQTAKPRLAMSKTVMRPTSGHQPAGLGGSGASNNSEAITSLNIRKMEARNKQEPKAAGASSQEAPPATQKSQLPSHGGLRNHPSASASRLPSMRIQRVSKGNTRLQSFSKVTSPQQAN